MTRHYCSLADHVYLPQLLALHSSLVRHSSEPFTLSVLAMDEESELWLKALNLPFLSPWSLKTFEEFSGYGKIRKTRSWQEYCWSCASLFSQFVMNTCRILAKHEPAIEVTYLDADMLFFSDPAPVFKEIGDRSIAITPHRLIPSKKHLETNGQFNVGWVTFKNNKAGRACLWDWVDRVRERCSAEVGCGDQQYLDDWPSKYRGNCHIIQNIGVNAAPWNIGNWEVTEGPMLGGVPIVLYHFHEYRHGERLTNYELRDSDVEFIYNPYIAAVTAAKTRIEAVQAVHLPA